MPTDHSFVIVEETGGEAFLVDHNKNSFSLVRLDSISSYKPARFMSSTGKACLQQSCHQELPTTHLPVPPKDLPSCSYLTKYAQQSTLSENSSSSSNSNSSAPQLFMGFFNGTQSSKSDQPRLIPAKSHADLRAEYLITAVKVEKQLCSYIKGNDRSDDDWESLCKGLASLHQYGQKHTIDLAALAEENYLMNIYAFALTINPNQMVNSEAEAFMAKIDKRISINHNAQKNQSLN